LHGWPKSIIFPDGVEVSHPKTDVYSFASLQEAEEYLGYLERTLPRKGSIFGAEGLYKFKLFRALTTTIAQWKGVPPLTDRY
jgi:hypothetical protein